MKKNVLKKYKVAIICLLFILVISAIAMLIILKSNSSYEMKQYDNEIFKIKYDSTWKIDKEEKNRVNLKHNKNSNLNIELITLDDKYEFTSVDNLIDDLVKDIEKQNSDYKLLTKEKDEITKSKLNGYKLLYEKEENQVLLQIVKKQKELIFFNFESSNEYFDLLLDSVQNIVYNFEIKEPTLELSTKLDLKETPITWNANDKITNTNDTQEILVATNNYSLDVSIPKIFKNTTLSSYLPQFSLQLDKGNIHLTSTIYSKNIYKRILDEDYGGLFREFNYLRDDDKYLNYTEGLEKYNNEDYLKYVYKNSYQSKNEFSGETNTNENIYIIYELDKNHIFEINIKSISTTIPKEIIDNIKISNVKNYSSFVNRQIENNYLVGELKEYADYSKEKIRYINLKLPTEYYEVDKTFATGTNFYEDRNYGKEKNEDLGYVYEVQYTTTYLSEEKAIESLKDFYIEDCVLEGNVNYNNKDFKLYKGTDDGYTDSLFDKEKYTINYKVLVYDLDQANDDCLVIIIKGHGKEISEEIINEVTNFDINIK